MKIKAERLLILIVAIAVCIIWTSSTLIASEKEQATAFVLHPSTTSTRHMESNSNNNNNKTQNNNSNSTRPYFILHIGPPKTATTFIQCGLHQLSKELADDDSYYFIGKSCPGSKSKMENNETSIPGHFLIMGLNDANTQNRGYGALKSRMDYHRRKGNSIIYSNEAFANHIIGQNSTWECLQSMLYGWNVRVVIGYRHYFDWIRSFYYQTNKQHAKLNKKWPNQGNGKAHPSFQSFLDYHLQRREADDLSVDGGIKNAAYGHHLTISAYKKFSARFDDIQILNLHNDEDMVTDFVCRMLPDADKTCHRLRTAAGKDKEKAHSLSKRASQSFDAQRISEAAFDKGYITNASPKEVVVEMVNKRIKETGINSRSEFLVCPPPSLVARLLNVSIEYENEMLAINHQGMLISENDKAKNAHMSMYRRNEADGRFCDVDPELVLKDKGWVTFLSKIGKDTAKNVKKDN